MDVVTYKILFMNSYIPLYRALPYIILFVYPAHDRMELPSECDPEQNGKLQPGVSQSINAVNMSTRVFCHFMKNELLNLQAEVESLECGRRARRINRFLWSTAEALYERLDDIHRHIRDNTMNFRQLQLGGLVRETVEETEGFAA